MTKELTTTNQLILSNDFIITKELVLKHYQLATESRQVSLLVRKEVFSGKAKFGVSGDGKELPQLAMAAVSRGGDFRSGYYRDQTWTVAVGDLTWQQFFAQLYGHTNTAHDPHAGGRIMNNHYATRLIDDNGEWKNQLLTKNSIGDISPTAGQIPRSVGLAYASKLYRENEGLKHLNQFSDNGNEICFATIGDASTSQGMFFETINAAGVLQVPLVLSVWDDGYGISVAKKDQTTKESISKALAGFQRNDDELGWAIFTVKAWDYVGLMETYHRAAYLARTQHVPCLVHVEECTQPQGHSSSGSHERYKTEDRMAWERAWDCNLKFREFIITKGYATENQLIEIENQAIKTAKIARDAASKAYKEDIKPNFESALKLIQQAARESKNTDDLLSIYQNLKNAVMPTHLNATSAIKKALRLLRFEQVASKNNMNEWLERVAKENQHRFNSFVYSQSKYSPMLVQAVAPQYDANAAMLDGREIINQGFDHILKNDPRVFVIGEDVGKIGDVNQTLHGLQDKYGALRLSDTGIRETTIIGQGIGAAIRGLKPIVEVQYLDYILYPFATLSDDLASLHYRTVGGQKAPLIVRTRGHRLEGIWHSGSPMGLIINGLRGLMVCVPRNMTQAIGMYNTLLKGDDPALVIESLNGYRLKEKLPNNLDKVCVKLGEIEILKQGTDITVVTYGSMCRIVLEAAQQLQTVGISVEVIDIQTLLPFDVNHGIIASIKKTNRLLVADEDMPGGGSAYILQQILDEQKAFRWLDSAPKTLAAKAHRPAYSSDGDYFSKPNTENVFETIYEIMHEANPSKYPY